MNKSDAALAQIEVAFDGLIANLEAPARRALARDIAKQLRISQQQRISAQLNTDGSAYAPRKPQKRTRQGALRRKMFQRLRQARYLKTEADAESATVGFVTRVDKLARVHQYGLRDRVRRGSREVEYPKRELLGFSKTDIDLVERVLLGHLAH